MKIVIFFFVLFLSVDFLIAQSIFVNEKPLEYYIANTAVFEENQTIPHTPIAPYGSHGQATENKWTESAWTLSLNGIWKFKWNDIPDKASWTFYKKNYDVSGWDEINVPSNWQMEGFGDAKFRNVLQPFPANPPQPPAEYNPTGSYRREFNVPDIWTGRRLLLYFEGVKTSAFIWVNGKYVGYNEG